MTANIREYSQWLPGIKNQVANALSHDWDQTNNDVTHIPFTQVPSQVTNSFKIVPLPNEISSYVTLLLLSKACAAAVQRGTQNNHTWLWKRWQEYCKSTGLGDDYFLKQVPQCQQPHILSAFTVAMRKGQFLQPADASLAFKTVSGAINHVAASFRSHRYPNPSHDKHNALYWNLAQ
jgi:hypothetical protein